LLETLWQSAKIRRFDSESVSMPPALPLSERGTLQTIAPIHETLCAAFAEPGEVVIDASGLVEGDLSLIQVLYAAKMQAMRENRAFRITPPDHPVLAQVFERAGMPGDFLENTPLA
jgi:anti-anti-sigma regulatory factor